VLAVVVFALLAGWLGLCALVSVCMFGCLARHRVEGWRIQRELAEDIRQYRATELAPSH
jgi:hypothetical protein